MIISAGGCSPTKETRANHESKTNKNIVRPAYETGTDSSLIPPIDAAVPSVFETASFGLG
jgi:hypothetical protein